MFCLNSSLLFAQDHLVEDSIFATVIKHKRVGYIYKSTDQGKNWQITWDGRIHAKTFDNRVKDIVFGNGRLVAVGNTILMSQNGGQSWKETILRDFPFNQMFTSNRYIKAVAYGNGHFVAAAPNYVLYSIDGIDWKYVRVEEMTASEKRNKKYGKYTGNYPPDKTDDLKFPLDVEFAEGRFYVTGGSRECAVAIYAIDDKGKLVRLKTTSLKKRYGDKAKLPYGGLNSIKYDGYNTLLAFSNSNKYALSTDFGITWNFYNIPGGIPGSAVAFNNGIWWAVNEEKNVYNSKNIVNGWQRHSQELLDIKINNIVALENKVYIFGEDGKIFLPNEDETWEESLITEDNTGLNILSMAAAHIRIDSDSTSDTLSD